MKRHADRPSRRAQLRVCEVVGCRGGLVQGRAQDGRPQFTCTKCRGSFTNGRDGGEYAAAVPMASPGQLT